MATDKSQSSFSRGRKWKIGFDLFARTLLVVAVVAMANYIGAQFPQRFYSSAQTRVSLSSRTVSVLKALTNNVTVTMYYDRNDDFYSDIANLLGEYQKINKKISVRTVDYVRDASEAEKIKERYNLPASAERQIIFDAGGGRFRVVSGDALIKYAPTGLTKDKKLEFGPVAFNAEEMFTTVLLTLETSKPFKAYYLTGSGEPQLNDSDNYGYLKFGEVLAQNFIAPIPIELSRGTDLPSDCDLLIIAAPTVPLDEVVLKKIDQYLAQGGRALILLDYHSVSQPTGLEPILRKWGVGVGPDIVRDPNHTMDGQDVIVTHFAHHPVMDPLAGNDLSLQMVWPRPVIAMPENSAPDAPEVTELAFSSADSVLEKNSSLPPRSYPLIAAVEQKNVDGIPNPRGPTRIIIAGDSVFLNNYYIRSGGNRDFLGCAVGWLLDRPTLLGGIGPRPVVEFRLMLTKLQQNDLRWLLLGALPGAVLLLGGLVWLMRRK